MKNGKCKMQSAKFYGQIGGRESWKSKGKSFGFTQRRKDAKDTEDTLPVGCEQHV
jgi:hypothetical protein